MDDIFAHAENLSFDELPQSIWRYEERGLGHKLKLKFVCSSHIYAHDWMHISDTLYVLWFIDSCCFAPVDATLS